MQLFIHKNASEDIVFEMAAILSGGDELIIAPITVILLGTVSLKVYDLTIQILQHTLCS